MRTLLLDTETNGLLGPAAQLAEVNDDGPARIFHILQRALGKNILLRFPRSGGFQTAGAIWRSPFLDVRFHFLERIALRNSTEFIKTSGGAPTAAGDSMLERGIKRRAINARLSTRNDLQAHRKYST